MNTFFGILIPFVGTTLGAACVFFMRTTFSKSVQRALTGFAAGVMVVLGVGLDPGAVLAHDDGRTVGVDAGPYTVILDADDSTVLGFECSEFIGVVDGAVAGLHLLHAGLGLELLQDFLAGSVACGGCLFGGFLAIPQFVFFA